MKQRTWVAIVLVPVVVILAGCRSPRASARGVVPMPPKAPPAVVAPTSSVQSAVAPAPAPAVARPAVTPRQVKQERRGFETKVDRLERYTAEQKKLQAQLNNELYDLQRKLAALQTQVQQVEGRAAETAKKIAEGETALSNLKNDVNVFKGRAPTEMPDAKVAEQKQQMEAQKIILQQRETEIRDLRSALAARDAMMKEQMRGAAAPAPAAPAAAAVNPPAAPAPAAVDSLMSAAQMVAEGNRLLRAGNADEAEKMFSSALVMDPLLASARVGLGSCRYARGDLEGARKLAEEVVTVEPRNPAALGLAGIVAWKQGDMKYATAMLERAIRQDPKDAQWHNYLGIVRYAQGKRVHAVDELEQAIALDPNLAEANFNLAVILATDDRPQLDKARQYYQASLRLGNARDEKLEGILYQ